jgi:replicative DNA helicase Mcm
VNGVIALWSNTPLDDDKIKDPYATVAIWEGKPQEKGRTVLVTGTLHPNCYTADTEVMTDFGWKLFKDLLDDDKIMSINPTNQEIDFVPFVNRTAYEYHGKMVHFFGRNYDLSVTPDHNMLFVSQKGFYREASASELLHKRNYYLPRAIGNWRKYDHQDTVKFGDLEINKKQYFRLWAWYLAEGNGRIRDKNSCEVKLAQKIPGNIIKDLPDLSGVLHERADSVCLYGQYAESFKKLFGIHAKDKYIPQFIKESSAENIREFLDAFSFADGTNRTREGHKKSYSDKRKEMYVRTSSKRMADDLCELIIKAGWMPSIDVIEEKGKAVHFQNGDYVINTDCYNINVCKSKFRGFGMDNQPGHKDRHEPFEEDYNGMVYDVELEKWHFLLVKRNGKCAWSGNCRGGWLRWGGKQADAMTAQVRGKAEKWDAAIMQARGEYQKQGTENPNDQTPGYIARINELYREKLGEKE